MQKVHHHFPLFHFDGTGAGCLCIMESRRTYVVTRHVWFKGTDVVDMEHIGIRRRYSKNNYTRDNMFQVIEEYCRARGLTIQDYSGNMLKYLPALNIYGYGF